MFGNAHLAVEILIISYLRAETLPLSAVIFRGMYYVYISLNEKIPIIYF
jgi:hypothetical protein